MCLRADSGTPKLELATGEDLHLATPPKKASLFHANCAAA
jgi:hypothetical protein